MEAGYIEGDYAEHKIELKDGERIIGVKSGRIGILQARHFDLQFVIGQKVLP